MTDINARKKQLTDRLDFLRARLGKIEDTLDDPHTKDDEDRAIETEDDEVLETLGRTGQDEIWKIEAALDRINDGIYGDCVKCSAPILAERLDVLPYTPFCKDCAP